MTESKEALERKLHEERAKVNDENCNVYDTQHRLPSPISQNPRCSTTSSHQELFDLYSSVTAVKAKLSSVQ